jgi:hypothetical protein
MPGRIAVGRQVFAGATHALEPVKPLNKDDRQAGQAIARLRFAVADGTSV